MLGQAQRRKVAKAHSEKEDERLFFYFCNPLPLSSYEFSFKKIIIMIIFNNGKKAFKKKKYPHGGGDCPGRYRLYGNY